MKLASPPVSSPIEAQRTPIADGLGRWFFWNHAIDMAVNIPPAEQPYKPMCCGWYSFRISL